MKLISLVFSFKNEELNLKELVLRIEKSLEKLKNWNYEFIFVNDASTDGSEIILLELQKNHPITIINMSRTFGEMPCFLSINRSTMLYLLFSHLIYISPESPGSTPRPQS